MEEYFEPQTLQRAIEFFSDEMHCVDYLSRKRWPNGVTCPTCGSQDVTYLTNQRRWKCKGKHERPQFSVKVGTVMEDSPIPLKSWLLAMWQVVNCKNGVSSYEIARDIDITQKAAWFLDHRIRFALGLKPGNKLSGRVEADETFIGGKARNMHKDVRARKVTGTGGKDKIAVTGILERGGQGNSRVRVTEVSTTKRKSFKGIFAITCSRALRSSLMH